MKTFTLMLFTLVLVTACGSDRDIRADEEPDEITFGFFYDRLAPHGHWVQVADYGWCWHPTDVAVGWRPYTHGHWVWVDDCGWYWHSDYDWGWACFHYGRWAYVDSRWLWVPGYEWSGAWVVWRNGGGYCGWAPLPPRAHWEVGVGIRTVGFSFETHIHEPSWVFVSHTHFVSPSLHAVILAPGETTVIIRKAPLAGSVTISGGLIMNHAITHEAAVKFTGKPIKAHKLRASATLGGASLKAGDGEVRVFRPRVGKSSDTPPRPQDKDRIEEASRKTAKERQDAEERGRRERGEKPDREERGKGEPGREEPRKEPGKSEPGREEPRKEPGKSEPGREEPRKEPGKSEPGKQKEPRKEPGKQGGKEPGGKPKKGGGKK